MGKIPWVLTEKGNPYLKRANQKERYARAIYPIPELEKLNIPSHKNNEIGEALATIAFAIYEAQEEANEAWCEASKTREEVQQEFQDEIDILQTKLNNSLIHFSSLEKERYENFRSKHFKLHWDGRSFQDKGIIIHFVNTGVGPHYTIECPICHEKEDITDVSSW